jgi:hypothetical protein
MSRKTPPTAPFISLPILLSPLPLSAAFPLSTLPATPPRSTQAQQPLSTSYESSKQLKAALNEIVSTEMTYVFYLSQLKADYSDPLRSDMNILSTFEHNEIFKSFDTTILPLHKHILSELRSSSIVSVSLVSSIFSKIAPYLTLYKEFVGGLGRGLALLQQLINERPLLQVFLSQVKSQSRANEPLESLLLMPVQRIPRYVLLLREVLKHNDSIGAVRDQLEDAIILIEVAAKKLDQGVDDIQRRIKLIDIQLQLQPSPTLSLITPNRRMVLDGRIKMQVKKKGWLVHYVGLVAPDLLIYGIEDGINYRNFVITIISSVSSDENDDSIFHVSTKTSTSSSSTSTVITFQTDSKAKAGQWIESLLSCRAELTDLCLRISSANANEASLALKLATAASRPSSKSLPTRLKVRDHEPLLVAAEDTLTTVRTTRIKTKEEEADEDEEETVQGVAHDVPETNNEMWTKSRSLSASEVDLHLWASSLAAHAVGKENEAEKLRMKTSNDDIRTLEAIRSLRASVDLDAQIKQSEQFSLLQSVTSDVDAAITFLRSIIHQNDLN